MGAFLFFCVVFLGGGGASKNLWKCLQWVKNSDLWFSVAPSGQNIMKNFSSRQTLQMPVAGLKSALLWLLPNLFCIGHFDPLVSRHGCSVWFLGAPHQVCGSCHDNDHTTYTWRYQQLLQCRFHSYNYPSKWLWVYMKAADQLSNWNTTGKLYDIHIIYYRLNKYGQKYFKEYICFIEC